MESTLTQSMSLEQTRRLAWRCRRGLLELDILLQRFAETHLNTLNQAELVAFDALLDLPDNTFLDIVTQRSLSPEMSTEGMQSLLKKLSPNLDR